MPVLCYIPALKDKRITRDEKEGCPQIKVLLFCFHKWMSLVCLLVTGDRSFINTSQTCSGVCSWLELRRGCCFCGHSLLAPWWLRQHLKSSPFCSYCCYCCSSLPGAEQTAHKYQVRGLRFCVFSSVFCAPHHINIRAH